MTGARALVLLVVVALGACAPRLAPPGEPVQPPRLAADAFIAADGARLPLRRWGPEDAPWAVIVALHGFNDYSRAFAAAAAAWAEDGVLTLAYDQRGFGEAPNRGLWPGIDAYTDDLGQVARRARARWPEAPLYLLGESMGAAVVMAAMRGDDPPPADGLILVAPAVWGRETMNPVQTGALWVAARTMPWLRLSGRGLRIQASDNVEMLKALARDPLVIKATRVDTIEGLVDLMDAALAAAPALDGVPALVLYGEKDEVVPEDPVEVMLERLPPGDGRRVAIYPEGYHMLLRDLQAEIVIRDVAAWIADPAAPLPSGAEADPSRLAAEAEGGPAAADGFAGTPAFE